MAHIHVDDEVEKDWRKCAEDASYPDIQTFLLDAVGAFMASLPSGKLDSNLPETLQEKDK